MKKFLFTLAVLTFLVEFFFFKKIDIISIKKVTVSKRQNDKKLIIWPEDLLEEKNDRIANQFKYKPPFINGTKTILVWHHGTWKGQTMNISRKAQPIFGCPVQQCLVTSDMNNNETADLIIFSVTLYLKSVRTAAKSGSSE